jgi:glycosyltransferase involved in cell wall biosynthesis
MPMGHQEIARLALSDQKKILITSCFARGGVVSMRNMATRFLREGGLQVDYASYAPYQLFNNLSVPIWQVGRKNPSIVMQENYWWVGTWLPEWEFMRSRPSLLWSEILSQYNQHLVVSGTALAANPLVERGLRPLAWLATPYWEERSVHVNEYSLGRKMMSLVDRRECEMQEMNVLNKCSIMALGSYTENKFKALAPSCNTSILPMPIDQKEFYPLKGKTLSDSPRIGFCGRLDDPRKNILFMLKSFAKLRISLPKATLVLVGGQLNELQKNAVTNLGLSESVEVVPFLPREQLLKFYQSLDLFVIPSLQEGLGIVGLEAMACGLPIVTTLCGGPQDFVYDSENGHVVHFNEQEMANAIVDILSDKNRWHKMSSASMEIIAEDFNYQKICETFWGKFKASSQQDLLLKNKKVA